MLKFWVFWAGLVQAYIVITLLLMDLYLFYACVCSCPPWFTLKSSEIYDYIYIERESPIIS